MADQELCHCFDHNLAQGVSVATDGWVDPETPYYEYDPASIAGYRRSWFAIDQEVAHRRKCLRKQHLADSWGGQAQDHGWRYEHHSIGLAVVRNLPCSVKRWQIHHHQVFGGGGRVLEGVGQWLVSTGCPVCSAITERFDGA
jgi:hypothetical protein